MGGKHFLLRLAEPALDVPPQPVRFALTRSFPHALLSTVRAGHSHSTRSITCLIRHHPASGHVNSANAHPERIGDELRFLALDPGLPEGGPGGPPKLATHSLGSPPEELSLVLHLEHRGVCGGRRRPGFEKPPDLLRARTSRVPALARDQVQHHVPRDAKQPVAEGPLGGVGVPSVHGGSDRTQDILNEVLGVGVLKPLLTR